MLGKILVFMKKWNYLCLLLVVGGCFLGYSGQWKVYEDTLEKIKGQMTKEISTAQDAGDFSEDTQEIDLMPDPDETNLELQGEDITVSEGDVEKERGPEDVIYETVEDDYFEDALFIGDSRTVGMYKYGGLQETADFYAATGLTVYRLFDGAVAGVPGEKETRPLEEILQEKEYGKIYLMLGINEMGTGSLERFVTEYGEAVERLKVLQPNAIIYLQGILEVTQKRSEKGDYITNEGIIERNQLIESLADYQTVYYLDINPAICDEEGGLNADYTYDGVHLKAQYVPLWKDILKTHAVVQVSP